jgi:hypothetical protein
MSRRRSNETGSLGRAGAVMKSLRRHRRRGRSRRYAVLCNCSSVSPSLTPPGERAGDVDEHGIILVGDRRFVPLSWNEPGTAQIRPRVIHGRGDAAWLGPSDRDLRRLGALSPAKMTVRALSPDQNPGSPKDDRASAITGPKPRVGAPKMTVRALSPGQTPGWKLRRRYAARARCAGGIPRQRVRTTARR